jgi:RHS repeat-associated protein
VASPRSRQTDPLGYAVRYQYDENGNRTATWDPKNQATTFTYDNRDRLTRITDPANGQTTYQYDAVGNLIQLTNARGHPTGFTYDAANRLTEVRDALNQPTSYQYDAAGNRTRMTDRKGQVHTYAYDQANRLTSVIAGGQTISYTYDATGNRLTLADPTGTTTYQYDNLDRQTRATYPDGRAVQATYDRAGNRTSLTNPGGITTTYVYDGANRLSQMAQGTLTWTLGYDQAGNRRILTHPNGTSTDYAYLNNHWLASITDKAPGGVTFQSTSYTYDQNGNRISQTDSSGATTFAYDALNRLTQAAYPGGYGTFTWTYDAVGNRTRQTAPSGTTNYAYDANSRLLTAGSTTYIYDQNGNLTGISTGQAFTWDVFNRMTQATGSGGTVSYSYNGDGLKTRRVGPDGVRNYYYDGIRPIWETDSAGAMTAQLDRDIFGNLLSRREASGARRYYHFDGLGSTTALTNESGAATSTLLYDAWGNQRAATGSDQGRYRFTGAELDTATALYHMGARFYDPAIGRWLSEDPVKDTFNPAALNFYTYAWSAPTGLVDPTGLYPWDAIFGTFVHNRVVGPWFVTTFAHYEARSQVRLDGGKLRLDMMMTTPLGLEVYELKPASHLRDPGKLRAAKEQLDRYVRALGGNARAGGSWNPSGQTIQYNSLVSIQLFSSPGAPGVIGYALVGNPNALQQLMSTYGWDAPFAAIVLALLLAAWDNPALISPALQYSSP